MEQATMDDRGLGGIRQSMEHLVELESGYHVRDSHGMFKARGSMAIDESIEINGTKRLDHTALENYGMAG
jgi:hypothetical protein